MSGLRRDRYGLRQVDSFENAIGIKPRDINLPPLKSTEIWNSPMFQALYAQQQAVETEAELEARKAQLYALMKRVAAEKRLPIEDIKRAVNEVARGAGGPALPAPPPGNETELREGEEVLGGDAMAALMQHVQQAVAVPESVLPQELHTHQGVKAAIADVGAEHGALAIDTQAQESLRAIQARDEEMRLARKNEDEVMQLFSLQSARKAAIAAGKGAAKAAHAFAQYMITPEEEEESWMAPSPGLFGVLKDIGGDISSTASWAMSESPEVTRRMQPYRAALEDVRYDVPMQEDPPERPARRRKVVIEGGSSSSSSSSAIAVPSYGTTGKLKSPLRITRQDVEGVIDKLSAVRDFGFGVGGLGY